MFLIWILWIYSFSKSCLSFKYVWAIALLSKADTTLSQVLIQLHMTDRSVSFLVAFYFAWLCVVNLSPRTTRFEPATHYMGSRKCYAFFYTHVLCH